MVSLVEEKEDRVCEDNWYGTWHTVRVGGGSSEEMTFELRPDG